MLPTVLWRRALDKKDNLISTFFYSQKTSGYSQNSFHAEVRQISKHCGRKKSYLQQWLTILQTCTVNMSGPLKLPA